MGKPRKFLRGFLLYRRLFIEEWRQLFTDLLRLLRFFIAVQVEPMICAFIVWLVLDPNIPAWKVYAKSITVYPVDGNRRIIELNLQ
jgi:hypothetical protein